MKSSLFATRACSCSGMLTIVRLWVQSWRPFVLGNISSSITAVRYVSSRWATALQSPCTALSSSKETVNCLGEACQSAMASNATVFLYPVSEMGVLKFWEDYPQLMRADQALWGNIYLSVYGTWLSLSSRIIVGLMSSRILKSGTSRIILYSELLQSKLCSTKSGLRVRIYTFPFLRGHSISNALSKRQDDLSQTIFIVQSRIHDLCVTINLDELCGSEGRIRKENDHFKTTPVQCWIVPWQLRVH